MNDAHKSGAKDSGGVLCLKATSNCANVLSGGTDGEVRLWDIGIQTKKLQSAQAVHKGPITGVTLLGDDS